MPFLIHKVQMAHKKETFQLPVTARIVKVGMQEGRVTLWYEFSDLDDNMGKRTFDTIATGEQYPISHTHLDTIFDYPLVWHIFEVNER